VAPSLRRERFPALLLWYGDRTLGGVRAQGKTAGGPAGIRRRGRPARGCVARGRRGRPEGAAHGLTGAGQPRPAYGSGAAWHGVALGRSWRSGRHDVTAWRQN
jgi:hypothetical protein